MRESGYNGNGDYIQTLEAARTLGCSQQTIVNMIKDGRLQGVDNGRGARPRWLVGRESVLARLAPSLGERPPNGNIRIEELEREVLRLSRVARHLATAIVDLGMAVRAQTEDGHSFE